MITRFADNRHLDDYDQGILHERERTFNDGFTAEPGPRVGDYVRFVNTPDENKGTDYTERRVSHVWRGEDGLPESIQTSRGGSYYLGNGYVSMSGSLFRGVPARTLARTDEKRAAPVWFFHHDRWQAHNAVHAEILFRIYTCTEEAPRT